MIVKCPRCGIEGEVVDNKCPFCDLLVPEKKLAKNSSRRISISAKEVLWSSSIIIATLITVFPEFLGSLIFWIIFFAGAIFYGVKDSNEKKLRNSKFKSERHIPKCPTCGSENIEKISVTEKIAFSGPFAPLYKTFKCNNCKYKW